MEQASTRFTFTYDYNQLYIYDAGRDWKNAANEYLDALDAANEAGLTVGTASAMVDVLMPRQENFCAALELRMCSRRLRPLTRPTISLSSISRQSPGGWPWKARAAPV